MTNQATKRIFIALNLPTNAKNRILPLLSELKRTDSGVKWVNADGLHITLHFLGDLTEARIDEVKLALQTFENKFQAFTFEIKGVSAFPNKFSPRVIFLECKQSNGKAVFKLQELLGNKLRELGLTLDNRPWTPHITLGRVKTKFRINDEKLKINLIGFSVPTFDLMQSHLSREGARYDVMAQYALLT